MTENRKYIPPREYFLDRVERVLKECNSVCTHDFFTSVLIRGVPFPSRRENFCISFNFSDARQFREKLDVLRNFMLSETTSLVYHITQYVGGVIVEFETEKILIDKFNEFKQNKKSKLAYLYEFPKIKQESNDVSIFDSQFQSFKNSLIELLESFDNLYDIVTDFDKIRPEMNFIPKRTKFDVRTRICNHQGISYYGEIEIDNTNDECDRGFIFNDYDYYKNLDCLYYEFDGKDMFFEDLKDFINTYRNNDLVYLFSMSSRIRLNFIIKPDVSIITDILNEIIVQDIHRVL